MRYGVSSRAVLGPYQTSVIEPFVKTANNYQPFTIFAKSLIIDVWYGSEYVSEFLVKLSAYTHIFVNISLWNKFLISANTWLGRKSVPKNICLELFPMELSYFSGTSIISEQKTNLNYIKNYVKIKIFVKLWCLLKTRRY